MQERYLGDIHDYYKFLFLKFLSLNLKEQIGLNWYLVDPKEISLKEVKKNDGEKRAYLFKKEKIIDQKILDECIALKLQKERKILKFSKISHLKEHIKFYDKKLSVKNRSEWINSSLLFFQEKQIVFLDPDNGFKEIQDKSKRSIKYIYPNEIKLYLDNNKTVVFTQFQSFNKDHLTFLKELKKQLLKYNIEINCPIVRNRTGPNTFFITIAKNFMQRKIDSIYKEYSRFNLNVDLINL
tara:strand:- start:344 stop:1060 length:717 start_codon:yes stop_codon:yes gene_type:complete